MVHTIVPRAQVRCANYYCRCTINIDRLNKFTISSSGIKMEYNFMTRRGRDEFISHLIGLISKYPRGVFYCHKGRQGDYSVRSTRTLNVVRAKVMPQGLILRPPDLHSIWCRISSSVISRETHGAA